MTYWVSDLRGADLKRLRASTLQFPLGFAIAEALTAGEHQTTNSNQLFRFRPILPWGVRLPGGGVLE